MLPAIADRIAAELAVRPAQVCAAIELLDGGATVPFIARYRKEATGALDDVQLRRLEERLGYLRELETRRTAVLDAIDGQGKLTAELRSRIEAAETKQRLEDLYLPYKVKRRTRAEIAREAGLEPLATTLLGDGSVDPQAVAAGYLREPFTSEAGDNPGVPDAAAALEGARWIVTEGFAEDAELLAILRRHLWEQGVLVSRVVAKKAEDGAKFRDYFEFAEAIARVPPHRALALFRGRTEDVLRLSLKLPEELEGVTARDTWGSGERLIARQYDLIGRTDAWLQETVRLAWRTRLQPSIEVNLLGDLRETAEQEAIRVFARNLQDLLLAAPAGQRATLGLDPGIRTGVKVAVVDPTGKLIDTATVYPFPPRNDLQGSIDTLAALARRHAFDLVAIGNGTASRETLALVKRLADQHPDLHLHAVTVSEAGASVYSASEFASREFPDLDVSLRGAVSIARRLQDPLAELVKIEPRSIGVGQYQHDVHQSRLAQALDAVVEDCVNRVGVDVNTASAPLLARISGLSPSLADNVVALRDSRGPFRTRKQLLDVPRLGPKAFEQAAGFLRIAGGDDPLDASAVHPEAYPVVARILADLQVPVGDLMKDPARLKSANPEHYVDDRFGLLTVQDIFAELEKPGRDPRPAFRTAAFREGVTELRDLAPDMVLEGVVTNVTNFGAFVDVGVHQDGLVHISMLADRFIKDPHEVVKAGDIVKVKVLEVDLDRKRIGLTMRLDAGPREAPAPRADKSAGTAKGEDAAHGGRRKDRDGSTRGRGRDRPAERPPNAMAAAFEDARKNRR